jgi:hypothetical protein
VTALSDTDRQRLAEQRAVVERLVAGDAAREDDPAAAGKLGALQRILVEKRLAPDQTYELQCLGVVLGDAFVQALQVEWVMVEDAFGRDPAVRLPGTTILLFPLTMISKRIERGEAVDVVALFNGIAAQVDQLRRGGV